MSFFRISLGGLISLPSFYLTVRSTCALRKQVRDYEQPNGGGNGSGSETLGATRMQSTVEERRHEDQLATNSIVIFDKEIEVKKGGRGGEGEAPVVAVSLSLDTGCESKVEKAMPNEVAAMPAIRVCTL